MDHQMALTSTDPLSLFSEEFIFVGSSKTTQNQNLKLQNLGVMLSLPKIPTFNGTVWPILSELLHNSFLFPLH